MIYLARHASHAEVGQVLSGRSEMGLSPAGRDEAAALGRRLAAVPLARIIASPRRRTRETAAAVARHHALPVEIAPALDEIDFGAFAGRSFAGLDGDPDWQRWNAARATARCPGGETMAEATGRAMALLGTLDAFGDAGGDAGGAVLCVTHCDIIRGIVTAWLRLGLDRLFAFGCDPAALTILARDGAAGRIVTLNERPYPDVMPAAARSRSMAATTPAQSPVLA